MRELAEKVGVSAGYLSQVSRGHRSMGVKLQARVEAVLGQLAKVASAQCPDIDRQFIWQQMDELGVSQNEVARRARALGGDGGVRLPRRVRRRREGVGGARGGPRLRRPADAAGGGSRLQHGDSQRGCVSWGRPTKCPSAFPSLIAARLLLLTGGVTVFESDRDGESVPTLP